MDEVLDRIAANVSSASANGQTVAFSAQRDDERLRDMIYADLSAVDPESYPPRNQRTTRTVPSFS